MDWECLVYTQQPIPLLLPQLLFAPRVELLCFPKLDSFDKAAQSVFIAQSEIPSYL